MRLFLFFSLITLCFWGAHAPHAYAVDDDVPRDCGEIEERDVRDTYELSYKLRYAFPRLAEDLVIACTIMQSLEDWVDALPRERRYSRETKTQVEKHVRAAQKSMVALESPLRAYRVWFVADVDNKIARAVRAKNLNDIGRDVLRRHDTLVDVLKAVELFVKHDGSPPPPPKKPQSAFDR